MSYRTRISDCQAPRFGVSQEDLRRLKFGITLPCIVIVRSQRKERQVRTIVWGHAEKSAGSRRCGEVTFTDTSKQRRVNAVAAVIGSWLVR
jgi:hypothetical protein